MPITHFAPSIRWLQKLPRVEFRRYVVRFGDLYSSAAGAKSYWPISNPSITGFLKAERIKMGNKEFDGELRCSVFSHG
jgi:hypothetical protein